MAEPAQGKDGATYAQIEALPDDVLGEILGGELVVSPRPALRHARASSRLGAKLGGPFDLGEGGPGGWQILDEPELHLGEDVLVPDLAGWRVERLPEIPDRPWLELAPDWVCEILSPSTAAADRGLKRQIYARERVVHLWLLDPIGRTLEVLQFAEAGYLVAAVHTHDAVVRIEPFEAIEIDLSLLWGGARSDPDG